MNRDRGRWTFGLVGLAGVVAGIALATAWQNGVSAQSSNARRVIRPAKAPNTGLPFSPGILAGNTLYISGHLGRDPSTNKLVAGGKNGPIDTVLNGRPNTAMQPFGKQLSDTEIAAVISYARNSWGNKAAEVQPAEVKARRK